MATININRQTNDPFDRYKMPKLQIKSEGTKTILINVSAIGKALNRLPICMLNKLFFFFLLIFIW